MDQANLRTRRGKDGVIDWDAVTRGWQAKPRRKLAWILPPCTGACRVWNVTAARRMARAWH